MKRLSLDISEEELQAMLIDAQRLKSREEKGTWELAAEEEENVRKRQAELAGEKEREADVNKMRGLRIRKARLRSVNRTRLKVCSSLYLCTTGTIAALTFAPPLILYRYLDT